MDQSQDKPTSASTTGNVPLVEHHEFQSGECYIMQDFSSSQERRWDSRTFSQNLGLFRNS